MRRRNHSFDRAKEGYWHLLPVQSMRTKAPGDSKEMVAARRAFLNAGYYGIFGQALGELCLEYGQFPPGRMRRSTCWMRAAARAGTTAASHRQFAAGGPAAGAGGFRYRKACGASGRKGPARGPVRGGVQLCPACPHRLGRPAAQLLLALCAGRVPARAAPRRTDDLLSCLVQSISTR